MAVPNGGSGLSLEVLLHLGAGRMAPLLGMDLMLIAAAEVTVRSQL
jgi:hypothetical protein